MDFDLGPDAASLRADLRNLVDEHGLNITHLATAAGVDRQLIRRLLRKHGFID